jgi:hypothetical protein
VSTQTLTTGYARPRASLAAILLAITFALGLGSGIALSPALRQSTQAITSGAAGADAVAQAHLAWLRDEKASYAAPAAFFSNQDGWQAYRQFRLGEEGYAP